MSVTSFFFFKYMMKSDRAIVCLEITKYAD